jgi:hypothetical protein
MDGDLRDFRFNRKNSLVAPRYSPVDMSVLPDNSLVDMSCMCTSSVMLGPPQKIMSITHQESEVIPLLNRLYNVQFFLVKGETSNLLLFSNA